MAEIAEFTEMEGHEVFRPSASLKVSEAARLLAAATDLVDDSGDFSAKDFNTVADLLDFLEERYIADLNGWQAIYKEKGFQYVIELAIAYLGEVLGDED